MQIAAIFFMIIYYLLSENIVDEQEDAQDAEADAIGDAVAEHHRNTNQGRDDDGDKQGALHSSRHQTTAEQDADETQDADWRKLAELHEGSFIGGDDTLYKQHCQSLLPGYRTPITT
mgnify:FL=1